MIEPLACLWIFKRASFTKYLPEPGGLEPVATLLRQKLGGL